MKKLRLRRADACHRCKTPLEVGTQAWWDASERHVICLACTDESATPPARDQPASSRPGASAQDEYERRRTNREERIRDRHPKLGGLILAVTDEPQHQVAWQRGAAGERAVAKRLAELERHGVAAIHDRRIPGSRANIDHIAVAPTGVWVIDAKRYSGRVELRNTASWFKPADPHLFVGGRDRETMVDKLHRQVEVVARTLAGTPHSVLPVRGMLAISGAEWSLFQVRAIDHRGVKVANLDNLIGVLRQPGALSAAKVTSVVADLDQSLPPAS